jgi:hypothetical protein
MYRSTPPPPPYYADLVALAETLLGEARYELAVIVSQMACELVVEATLAPGLSDKRRWNFNLDNKEIRKIYVSLTRDAIERAPFWSRFQQHARRRHTVTHGGRV